MRNGIYVKAGLERDKFLIPMRGNESRGVVKGAGQRMFPIPMRGNEMDKGRVYCAQVEVSNPHEG